MDGPLIKHKKCRRIKCYWQTDMLTIGLIVNSHLTVGKRVGRTPQYPVNVFVYNSNRFFPKILRSIHFELLASLSLFLSLSLSLSLSLYLVDGLYLKVAYGCNSAIFIQFFLSRGPIDYFGVLQGCRNRLKEYGLSLLEAKASLSLLVFLSMKSNMNSSCNSKS